MGTLTMDTREREEFLAATHIAVISINRMGGAPPLATPVWYGYTPGGDITVLMEPTPLKCRLLLASGGFTLTVQNEEYPYSYVSVSGDATVDNTPRYEDIIAISRRYRPESEATAFADASFQSSEVLARMRPTAWFSQDYTKL
jgi:nitroimidazol reductase NimA-like FMN-containing flavoprotein (pyridoxamine 5'-phosphate oxidase superfamily)